jgi:hypothetical protein
MTKARVYLFASAAVAAVAIAVGPGFMIYAVSQSPNGFPDSWLISTWIWLGWLWIGMTAAAVWYNGWRKWWLVIPGPFLLWVPVIMIFFAHECSPFGCGVSD